MARSTAGVCLSAVVSFPAELAQWHRTGEQEPLQILNPLAPEVGGLLLRLHSFGYQGEAQPPAEVDDVVDDMLGQRLGPDATDEGAIDSR